jgi:uncharacterized protein with HEPN domain
MTPKGDRIYLEHILDCVALIQDYTCNGKAEFMTSVLVQDAVLRRFTIIPADTTPTNSANDHTHPPQSPE